MALRFRRSFKIAPGLRVNMSRSGFSWSVGPRGASMTFGRRGAAANFGIPGSGLSFRQAYGSSSSRAAAQPLMGTKVAIVRVDDEGNVSFLDGDTQQPLDQAWVALAKKQA